MSHEQPYDAEGVEETRALYACIHTYMHACMHAYTYVSHEQPYDEEGVEETRA